MTIFSGVYDTKMTVYRRGGDSVATGHYSRYVDDVHPGTNESIKGWRWDDRIWPGEDTDYNTFIPVLPNIDLTGVDEENFQSGTGTGTDCTVEDIKLIAKSGVIEH